MQPTNAAYGGCSLAFEKRPTSIESDIREKANPNLLQIKEYNFI